MISPNYCGQCEPSARCVPPCPNVSIDWLVFEQGVQPRLVSAPDGRTLLVLGDTRRHLPGRSFLLEDKLYRVASDDGAYNIAGAIRLLKPRPYSSFYEAPRRYES